MSKKKPIKIKKSDMFHVWNFWQRAVQDWRRPVKIKKSSMFHVWKVWQRVVQTWKPEGTGDFRRCNFCGILYEKIKGTAHTEEYCSVTCSRDARFGFYPDSQEMVPYKFRRKNSGYCDIYTGVLINSDQCRRREKLGCISCIHLDADIEMEPDSWQRPDVEEFV